MTITVGCAVSMAGAWAKAGEQGIDAAIAAIEIICFTGTRT
jgi:hypothetical protein